MPKGISVPSRLRQCVRRVERTRGTSPLLGTNKKKALYRIPSERTLIIATRSEICSLLRFGRSALQSRAPSGAPIKDKSSLASVEVRLHSPFKANSDSWAPEN